ncbi:MAG: hypothetical protein HYU36_03365 [Planctomycetes bacterium]|nr:hypothetical protein [Planctomycetota bacterium]
MTSRDRVSTLLSGRQADCIGLFEHGAWPETLAAWVHQGYPTRRVSKAAGDRRWNPEDGRSIPVTEDGSYPEPVPFHEHFEHDMVSVGGWFDMMPLRGRSEVVQETEEWVIRRNGAGAAYKHWKHRSGTPGPVDFLMSGREIWERDYRPHLLALDPARVHAAGQAKSLRQGRARGVWTFFGHLFIWEQLRQSLGDESMYAHLVLDPGWIRDFNRVYTDFYKTHYAYLFEHGGVPDGVWIYEDLAYNSGLLASPEKLRDLVFPFYREIVDFFKGYGLPVILHTDGNIGEAIPMILEAGFVGLNPIERKNPANDPLRFAEQYGDRLVFIGGFDERILETNDKAVIRREISSYLEGMKARGARLLFATDHTISSLVRYDSYRYGLDVYRAHRMY